MGKLRCSKCKGLAHVIVNKKAYCLDCVPKPIVLVDEEPTTAKVIKEKPHTEIVLDKIASIEESAKIERRKAWWKRNSG